MSETGSKDAPWWTTAPRYSPKFSDMKIIVGAPDKIQPQREYALHRIFLITQSSFFSVACENTNFKEARDQEIRLPECDPETFDIIVYWLYGGGFQTIHSYFGTNSDDFVSPDNLKQWSKMLDVAHMLDMRNLLNEALELVVKLDGVPKIKQMSLLILQNHEDYEDVLPREETRMVLLNKLYDLGVSLSESKLKKFIVGLNSKNLLECFIKQGGKLEKNGLSGLLFRDITLVLPLE